MTQDEVVKLIGEIVNRMVHKFTFGYYDIDDIKQEAFIIAMDGLERYDESRPLENFLSVHIANRLKSFKRDNYFRQDPKCKDKECEPENLCPICLKRSKKVNTKKNIMCPIEISGVDDENEKSMSFENDVLQELEREELQICISKNMPMELKLDYTKMLDGIFISKPKKTKILEVIKESLIKCGYTDER